MSFPINPTNGQTASLNNIVYTHNAGIWTRTGATANITTTGNLTASGIVVSNGIYWSNGAPWSGTLVNIPNSALANSSISINGTQVSLGGGITVAASAGSLTGAVLNSGVTGSSLTTLGTLSALNLNGTATFTGTLNVTGSATISSTFSAGSSTLSSLSITGGLVTVLGSQSTGSPTLNGGIRVLRGTSAAVQLRWTETAGAWQLTNDGANYANILTTGSTIDSAQLNNNSITINGTSVPLGGSISVSGGSGGTNTAAANLTGSNLSSNVTASSLTSVGTLSGLTVSGNIVPNANASVNLGSPTAWFNTLYGISTQAKYADLAEIYATDSDYQPGTVMVVGGNAEVTASYSQGLDNVIGVISANPAYLMNSHYVGQAVALKGRVPVMVIGPVMKGQRIRTSDTLGCAEANCGHGSYTFAIALFTNDDPGIKLVECVIL
jgi:hypothetical protein